MNVNVTCTMCGEKHQVTAEGMLHIMNILEGLMVLECGHVVVPNVMPNTQHPGPRAQEIGTEKITRPDLEPLLRRI